MNIMPAYRSTDSHPYQQNHMKYPHYNPPIINGIPPQMNMNPSKSSPPYEQQTWPYIGGHGYPNPMQFCCGHHKLPGYWTYTPSYPQFPTSSYPHIPTWSPMCFSGDYPAYTEPFCVPCAPPPHYSMEMPRYEYDKCMPREYHCCGCPNHPFSHKEGKGVKIEEHEPEGETKVNTTVSPSQLKNHPYPFVWIPSQYIDGKDLKKSGVAEVRDHHDNGWLPLDINSLANMKQDSNGRKGNNRPIDNVMREAEDGKTNPSQQGERNMRGFPFPVVWIPNFNVQESEKANYHDADSPPNHVNKVPHELIDSGSVVSHPSDDASKRSNVNGNDLKMGDSDVTREETDEKSNPIKQMELQRSESENHEKRVRDIPVKQIEGDVTGKETQTNVKRQSSSPKKSSKLPPVCLRVDPLPSKKNGNGSSRSPSPSKKHSAASTDGSSSSSSNHNKDLENAKHRHASDVGAELEPKDKTIKVVEVSCEKKDKTQAPQKDSNTTEDLQHKNETIKVLDKSRESKLDHIDGTRNQVTSNNNTKVHGDSNALTNTGESWTNGENGDESERKVNDMIKENAIEATDAKDAKEKKVLSDEEAATLIQAAYRGFQMRKWEPLKKLKHIAGVNKHVADVRDSIQALETSSNTQIDEREKVTIGETIMRLLLKLDTIQGLHPSFREMRKSLAKELTSLQEKLDSVIAKKSQLQMEDPSMGKLMNHPVASNVEFTQEQPVEEVLMPENNGSSEKQAEETAASENSSDNIVHRSQDVMEQDQDQLSIKNGNPSHDDERLQSTVHSVPVDQAFNEEPKPLQEETVNDALNSSMEEERSGCDISGLQLKSELEGIPNEADEVDMKAWEELPGGVIDDQDADNIDFKRNKDSEIKGEELHVSEVSNTSCEVEELPIGLLDDNATDSEKHQETETSAQILQSEEEECNSALMTHSLADGNDVTKDTQLDEHEQQQLEEQSTRGSDDWVKVEHEQDGFKEDASKIANVEGGSREENNEQSMTKANEDACLEVKEVTINETPEEEVAVKETQCEKVSKDDAENKEVLFEQKDEHCVTSPLLEEVPLKKQDGERDTDDKNLVEENEKLRKMMQKLLEAGNEQLTVISSLTERVKDLEKKLAKKKRVKTKHCRPTTSKSCFKKSSNNQLQDIVM